MPSSGEPPNDISRIISTDFYFVDPFNKHGDLLTLSVAYLKDDERRTSNSTQSGELKLSRFDYDGTPRSLIHLLLLSQADQRSGDPRLFSTNNENLTSIAHRLLAQAVITERSPPVATILSELLQQGSVISALISTGVSPAPLIAVTKVAGGTILMGAVVGVSTGLKRGLADVVGGYIRSWFGSGSKNKKKAPKRKSAPSKAAKRRRADTPKAKAEKKRPRARAR
jgi:hypothetical protein